MKHIRSERAKERKKIKSNGRENSQRENHNIGFQLHPISQSSDHIICRRTSNAICLDVISSLFLLSCPVLLLFSSESASVSERVCVYIHSVFYNFIWNSFLKHDYY